MRANKVLKFLALGALILVIVAGTGLWVYSHYFTLHPAVERELREQFGDAFFDEFNELEEAEPEPDPEQTSPEEIVERYEHKFESLEERAHERLEDLFEKAMADYHQQKAEGTFDRFKFVNKYIQAGRLLEKQVDAVFYALLEQMETELKQEDLPTDVVDEAEEKYEEAKKEQHRELFGRMREKLD